MTDQRWPSVDRLLQAALDRPPQEREAFVRTACADDIVLRDEVLSLLAHTASAGGFLETPSDERVRLNPGRRLAGYEVRERIGSGGMGDVYRATDAKLRRDIALKVLPSDASHADRRDRFAREARAIAALNHPGIVTIHSVEEDAGVHFLTMELVEGRTLAEAISPGGLPLPRLLDIAIPLADAIGAAHTRGIVHRDIKPANVMVTREGRIKVLDFGLAKLRTPVGHSLAPTTLEHGQPTREGSIVGTCAYMSPEQAEGRDVDHRSDVFSLGVLIYELATGVRPFKGDSTIAVLSSIVKNTPVPVANLRPDLPAGLSRIISRCLAKDPGRRYQSVLDLRNDLEEVQAGPIAEAPAVGWWTRRTVLLIVAAGAVILTVVAGYLVWSTSHPETAVGEFQRLTIPPPSGTNVMVQDAAPRLAISPDGKWVAFHVGSNSPDRRGLYVHSTGNTESRLIRAGELNGSPFFSPDSSWLGFWSDGALWKIPVDVGEARQIAKAADQIRGASWGDDGNIVFASTTTLGQRVGMLYRVRAEGGEVTQITVPASGITGFYFPHVLPGSKAALVMLLPDRVVAVVSVLDGSVIRRLFPGSTPRYFKGGWLVFRRTGTLDSPGNLLYAAPFDGERLEVTGEPRRLHEAVIYNLGGSETSAFDVAVESGALVYVPPRPRVEAAELVWLGRHGEVQPIAKERQDYSNPAFDPQGLRVAVQILKGEQGSLSVYDIASKVWTPLASSLKVRGPMTWSPNGEWIVFGSLSPLGAPNLYRVPPTGGEAEALASTAEDRGYDRAPSVFADEVLFERQVGGNFELRKVSLNPPWHPVTFLGGPFQLRNPQIHPAGLYVAYQSNEFVRPGTQVLLRSSKRPERNYVTVSSGTDPKWSRDGRTLYYSNEGVIWQVRVMPGSGDQLPRLGPPERALDLSRLDKEFVFTVAGPSPDGQRFLAVKRSRPPREENLLIYVPNWMQAVARDMKKGR